MVTWGTLQILREQQEGLEKGWGLGVVDGTPQLSRVPGFSGTRPSSPARASSTLPLLGFGRKVCKKQCWQGWGEKDCTSFHLAGYEMDSPSAVILGCFKSTLKQI